MSCKCSMSWALGLGLLTASLVGCGGGQSDAISLIGRQNSSGTYDYFREATIGKKGKFRPSVSAQSGSKDVVELVSKTPSAMGYSGMGYATDEVKMLKVSAKTGEAGVEPTAENAANGSYPLARGLYIYILGEPQGAAQHYIAWILSAEGQDVVRAEGYVPNPTAGPTPEGEPADGVIRVEGSDTLVQVAGKWAEIYCKKYPNVSVNVGGGGSGKGIAALIQGETDLANASREIKPAEKELAESKSGKVVKEIIIGKDALAVFVHKDNPLDSVSLEQLGELYKRDGSITTWKQLGGKDK